MKLEVHHPSSLRDALTQVEHGLQSKSLIIILGTCSVTYEGRGASKIGDGERLVIVKPDGAVLVHRPLGYSPVNWQPDSKAITVNMHGDRLVLRSIRERPREILEVSFSTVDLVVLVRDMQDSAEFIEYLDEHEIRDYIARHPELIEPGLRIVRVEKPVEPGFVDLYAVDSSGRHVVIEIKRVTAGKDAVLQLKRYIDAMRRLNPNASIRGILVAPSITKQALSLLYSFGLEYREISLEKLYKLVRDEQRRRQATGTLLDFMTASKKSK